MLSLQLMAAAHSLPGIVISVAMGAAPVLAGRPVGGGRHVSARPTVRTIIEHPSSKSPPYRAVLDVPQVVWPGRTAVSDRVNVAIVDWVEGRIRTFAAEVRADLAKARNLPSSLPESNLRLSYQVTRLDGRVLSLHLVVEAYVRGQASPSQVPDGLTFNLATGASDSLSSLFRPHASYLPRLARLARAGLKSFRPAGAHCYVGPPGPSARASAFRVWWLSGNKLVLAYPAGRYTAAYCGPPTIAIPAKSLGSLLAAGGPLVG